MLSLSARATDSAFPSELLAPLSPPGWANIPLAGGYRWPRTVTGTPYSVILHSAVIDPNWLRFYAYRAIRRWWAPPREHGAYVHWQAHLYDRCQNYTCSQHAHPLDYRECHHIAKSVAHWVWTRFSPECFSERQAALGRRRGREGAPRGACRESQRARREGVRGVEYRRLKGVTLRILWEFVCPAVSCPLGSLLCRPRRRSRQRRSGLTACRWGWLGGHGVASSRVARSGC